MNLDTAILILALTGMIQVALITAIMILITKHRSKKSEIPDRINFVKWVAVNYEYDVNMWVPKGCLDKQDPENRRSTESLLNAYIRTYGG